jgi:N-glycosylase/DNA lyase
MNSDRITEAVVQLAPEIDGRINRGPPRRNERDLWRELSCCVLSSQVPYELALAAAKRIHEDGILLSPLTRGRLQVERKLLKLLSGPLLIDGHTRRYRFPQIRAAQLAEGWLTIRTQFDSLTNVLEDHSDAYSARAWLVREISGIGPKQASMLLRNVGVTYDLAVIDRHIIRYMLLTGLCSKEPVNLGNLRTYQDHESSLRGHAEKIGYDLGVMDWAIWIVMRAAAALERT